MCLLCAGRKASSLCCTVACILRQAREKPSCRFRLKCHTNTCVCVCVVCFAFHVFTPHAPDHFISLACLMNNNESPSQLPGAIRCASAWEVHIRMFAAEHTAVIWSESVCAGAVVCISVFAYSPVSYRAFTLTESVWRKALHDTHHTCLFVCWPEVCCFDWLDSEAALFFTVGLI